MPKRNFSSFNQGSYLLLPCDIWAVERRLRMFFRRVSSKFLKA
jgi:hypothetical protein